MRDQLEQLEARLPRAMQNQLKQQRQQLEQLAQTLHLVSPLATLGRGYSILLDDNGTAVRSASAASAGQRLKARLHDGELSVRVEAETPYTLSLLD